MQIVVRPNPEQQAKASTLDRFVTWQELGAVIGVGRHGLLGMVNRGELPRMTKVGLRRMGWYESDLRAAGIRFKGAA